MHSRINDQQQPFGYGSPMTCTQMKDGLVRGSSADSISSYVWNEALYEKFRITTKDFKNEPLHFSQHYLKGDSTSTWPK